MKKKKLSVNLDLDTQYRELELLMAQDGQTNITAFIVYLIYQEKKRRIEGVTEAKRAVGRPKKTEEIVDTNLYPAPYKGGVPYSREDLELYYAFRNKEMPPMPNPLTDKEISKFKT